MDFLTRKELNGLKGEIKASEYALEAEKYTFQRELINKIGPSMIEQLSKPKTIENKTVEEKKKCCILRIFKKKR